jgi:malate dehydrogenase (oxaloacetate-decarboxylating)(NADP+)
MQLACIDGIAALARATTSAEAAAAYRGEQLTFGPDYLIPKPFDPRLMGVVASAVAKAAMETGVATRPLADLEAYKQRLDGSVFRSALLMRPVFEAARTAARRSSLPKARMNACCAPPMPSWRKPPKSRS